MFDFFGQPKDYSDILKRIFFFTLLVGIIGTSIIAWKTPVVWELVKSFKADITIGPVKIKYILLVLVPFAIALVSRLFKLHEKVSDLFKIRAHFDLKHIITPLANGVNLDVNELNLGNRSNQTNLMYKVFYKYAGFNNPTIDIQLVRTALDQWGWFWVFVESTTILILLTVVSLIVASWKLTVCFLVASAIFAIIASLLVPTCCNAAKREVIAILADENRKQEIKREFDALSN